MAKNKAEEYAELTESVVKELESREVIDPNQDRQAALELTKVLIQEIAKDARTERIGKDRKEEGPEPATDKQKSFMDDLGLDYDDDVTKEEASKLIDQKTGD